MLARDSLIAFQKLYLQEYGVELSDEDAEKLGTNLVNLYRAVYLPSRKPAMRTYEEAH